MNQFSFLLLFLAGLIEYAYEDTFLELKSTASVAKIGDSWSMTCSLADGSSLAKKSVKFLQNDIELTPSNSNDIHEHNGSVQFSFVHVVMENNGSFTCSSEKAGTSNAKNLWVNSGPPNITGVPDGEVVLITDGSSSYTSVFVGIVFFNGPVSILLVNKITGLTAYNSSVVLQSSRFFVQLPNAANVDGVYIIQLTSGGGTARYQEDSHYHLRVKVKAKPKAVIEDLSAGSTFVTFSVTFTPTVNGTVSDTVMQFEIRLEESPSGLINFTTVLLKSAPEKVDGLKPNTLYEIQARAFASHSQGRWSASIKFITSCDGHSITLGWITYGKEEDRVFGMKFEAEILPLCQASINYSAQKICQWESIGEVTQKGLFFNETKEVCPPKKSMQCNTILYDEFCSDPKENDGLQIWVVVVIAAAFVLIVIVIVICVFVLWFYCSKVRRRRLTAASNATESENVSCSEASEIKRFPSQKAEDKEVTAAVAEALDTNADMLNYLKNIFKRTTEM